MTNYKDAMFKSVKEGNVAAAGTPGAPAMPGQPGGPVNFKDAMKASMMAAAEEKKEDEE